MVLIYHVNYYSHIKHIVTSIILSNIYLNNFFTSIITLEYLVNIRIISISSIVAVKKQPPRLLR